MENQATIIGKLFENTERYTSTLVELYKLKAIGKSADIISTLTTRLALILFVSLFFLILKIGIALWLGEIFKKNSYGFFSVAGFYALAGIILYFFRNKWIKAPLRNAIITHALN